MQGREPASHAASFIRLVYTVHSALFTALTKVLLWAEHTVGAQPSSQMVSPSLLVFGVYSKEADKGPSSHENSDTCDRRFSLSHPETGLKWKIEASRNALHELYTWRIVANKPRNGPQET